MPDETLDQRIISDHDLVLYSVCPHAFYLNRLEGKSKIPTSGAAAKALFFLSKRKKLFEVRDKNIGVLFDGQRRAGPKLTHIENMTREELGKYMPFSSAEAFGGSLKGIWTRVLKNNYYNSLPVYWHFAAESWTIGEDLRTAGINYWNFLLGNGAPVMGLVDKDRTFMFEGQQFRVKIPEIRFRSGRDYTVFVDNPTLFEFKGERIDNKRTNASNSAIITLLFYGLTKLLKKYPITYMPKIRAPQHSVEYFQDYIGNILPNLVFRNVNLMNNTIDTAGRSDSNLDSLQQLIERYNEGIVLEKFEPNKGSCNECRYNTLGVNGKSVCEYRSKKAIPSVSMHYFRSKNFRLEESVDKEGLTLTGFVDQSLEVRRQGGTQKVSVSHEVARYRVEIREFADRFVAETRYRSDIFGVVFSKTQGTFETALIKKMDEALQTLADKKGRDIQHFINFDQNFGYAGKTKALERLREMGYNQEESIFSKTYTPKTGGELK